MANAAPLSFLSTHALWPSFEVASTLELWGENVCAEAIFIIVTLIIMVLDYCQLLAHVLLSAACLSLHPPFCPSKHLLPIICHSNFRLSVYQPSIHLHIFLTCPSLHLAVCLHHLSIYSSPITHLRLSNQLFTATCGHDCWGEVDFKTWTSNRRFQFWPSSTYFLIFIFRGFFSFLFFTSHLISAMLPNWNCTIHTAWEKNLLCVAYEPQKKKNGAAVWT